MLVAAGVAAALAHEPERTVARELVWLRGRRGAPAATLRLRALGAEHPFAVAEVQRFPLSGGAVEAARGALEEAALALQGPRELLARFARARPDQVVTMLAERRPQGADLFVLALELCPAE